MVNLGVLYYVGKGAAPDYAKAREWYEKAAAKGEVVAMLSLALLYSTGQGGAKNYAKACEWFEKAAANGDLVGMDHLGSCYDIGFGVAQDFAKAREWYEKAAAKGYPAAQIHLERLPIREAQTTGRYAEALRFGEALAAKVETVETKRDGKPGKETAEALNDVAWSAILAREFSKALTATDRSHTLFPHDLQIESNRAHALMFMGHADEARVLYLAHRGEPLSEPDKVWERGIAEDFAEFRKAGLTHPMMADIEKELGISR